MKKELNDGRGVRGKNMNYLKSEGVGRKYHLTLFILLGAIVLIGIVIFVVKFSGDVDEVQQEAEVSDRFSAVREVLDEEEQVMLSNAVGELIASGGRIPTAVMKVQEELSLEQNYVLCNEEVAGMDLYLCYRTLAISKRENPSEVVEICSELERRCGDLSGEERELCFVHAEECPWLVPLFY